MRDLPGAHQQLQMSSAEKLPIGQKRFITHLSELYNYLRAASLAENSALTLFNSPARQSAFYLQALARIYRKLHNEKQFNVFRTEFKALEDQLGRVDFFNAYLNEFSAQENFPPVLLKYFSLNKEVELVALQKMLVEKKWIIDEFEMVQQILTELTQINWLDTADDRQAVAAFLEDDLDDLDDDYRDGKFDFNLIEEGVHEFRRKVRWFSIYAQALNGLIQLQESANAATELKKYLTPETLNSPYSKLPKPESNNKNIYINAPHYYAVSWVVNEIGILKDDGLRIHALTDAIVETGMKSKTDAESHALTLATLNKYSIDEVSKLSKEIADEFMQKDEIIKRIRKEVAQAMNEKL